MRGLSEVTGMMEETVFRNMVRDSKIVTPGIEENVIRFLISYFLSKICPKIFVSQFKSYSLVPKAFAAKHFWIFRAYFKETALLT